MKKGYRLLASILALAFSFSLMASWPGMASAEENSSVANRFNVVMVIDKSGSLRNMNGVGTDPEGLRFDAMKLFLGLLTETGNNVGAVVFDNEIRYDSGLLPMNSMEDKKALVSAVEALGTSYDTDIGRAVLRATEILHGMQEKNGLPCTILLLTDGMTDFPMENRWIMMENSRQAAAQALQNAQDEGITIHGILLDVDGRSRGGEEEIRRYTDGTDGEYESVAKPEDLAATFRRFYSIINKTEYTGAHKVEFSPAGEAETGFMVPNFGVEEVNLVIERTSALSGGTPVEIDDIRISQPDGSDYAVADHELQTSRFLLIKIPQPASGSWNVKLRGEPGDSIDVCLIYNASLNAVLTRENAGDPCEVLKPIRLRTVVTDADMPLDEESLASISVELCVKNLSTGEVEKYPLTALDGVFSHELVFDQGGEYGVTASVRLSDIEVRSNTLKLRVEVPPPAAKVSRLSDLFSCGSIENNVWSIALSELFEDPKGTGLRYALSDDFGGAVRIEDGVLRADLAALNGQASFTVTATDAYDLSAEIPFDLHAELPSARLSGVTDIMDLGRVRGNVWEVELAGLFDDPAGEGLTYALSDDCGGAIRIENGLLKADLAKLRGTTAFTVTATDAHGLSASLPFEFCFALPAAKLDRVSDIADVGRVRDNVWEVELQELFEDPVGKGMTYALSDDFGGSVTIEDDVLRADLSKLEGHRSFTVTAADARGLSTSLPFEFDVVLPKAAVERVTDILETGSIRDNVWSVDLAGFFEDADGFSYALSDDFGGAVSIEDSMLRAKLDELGGGASFTVTATDPRGLSTELPFELAYTLPTAKLESVTDIEALGRVRDNAWELELQELFEDPKGTALSFALSDDLGGAVTITDDVLTVKLPELDGKAAFTVTATDEHGMSVKLPFDLAVEMPKPKSERVTDPLACGRFTRDGWEIELASLFDDPAGKGLSYALSDDLGGAVTIEDGVLKVRLQGQDSAAFTVTATDARGFTTALPFDLHFPAPTAKVEEVAETVKTGLMLSGTWSAPLDELFEDPKGTELEYTVSDDLGGAVTITDDTIEAAVDGLGSADFTVTATDDFGLSTEIPVQLVEKDMTWIYLGIALLVLILLIVLIVVSKKRKK